jgi:fucose permease
MRNPTTYGLTASYAGMMCLAIAVNLLPVFLTTLSADLGGPDGLTNEQLGRLAAITFAGLVGGILLTGPLADRLGPSPFAIGGNALIAVGLALLGTARGYGAVCVAVFIMGAGAGVLDMVLSPIVSALQPHRRTAAMNWLHSFYCTGAVATVLLASLGLRYGLGWRGIALGLTPLPALVAAAFVLMEMPPLVAEGGERTRLRRLIREPYFLVALAAIFLGGATEVGLAQWLPAYAETTLGFSKWTGGMSLLFFSLAMAVGRIGVGVLGPRINPFRLLIVCCWGSVALFVVGCFAPWPAVALAACMAAGVTGSSLWPSTLGITADHYPRGGASMFGLLAAFGNFGCVFMPWMVGMIADWTGLRIGLSTATLCPLLMVFLLAWMRRRQVGDR